METWPCCQRDGETPSGSGGSVTQRPPNPLIGLFAGTPAPRNAVATPRAPAAALRASTTPGSFTVTQLTLRMKGKLEELGDVAVAGEISGFKVATQGHWYFDLKDKNAKVSVVVFFKDTRRSPAVPHDGDFVVVTGSASYHLGFGKAQLLGRLVMPAGAGDLAAQLEELRARLQAEGLFNVDRKKILPAVPVTVGVVTSLSGAAIHDVLTVIHSRSPRTSIIVSPSKVQGDHAAADIAEALRRLDALGRCELILVVRGGGAREDLHAFNTEAVVRAIVACSVPIVAGVGHEVDVTLADLAADVRAATPSQAAEIAVPREDDLRRRVQNLENRLHAQARAVVDGRRHQLHDLWRRLPAPAALHQLQDRKIQILDARLALASPQAQLSARARRITELSRRLERGDPRARVVAANARVETCAVRLKEALHRRAAEAASRLRRSVEQLDALSPTAVLRRGWALVTVGDDPSRIARASDLTAGNQLRVRIDGGDARVTVNDIDADADQ